MAETANVWSTVANSSAAPFNIFFNNIDTTSNGGIFLSGGNVVVPNIGTYLADFKIQTLPNFGVSPAIGDVFNTRFALYSSGYRIPTSVTSDESKRTAFPGGDEELGIVSASCLFEVIQAATTLVLTCESGGVITNQQPPFGDPLPSATLTITPM
ncbi:hypothetical protein IC620_05615 [Hazenella sp. IB182357]|uniref:Uncharacterized protein n=1 Tax=Polycladospora coralii TaxID=2771432 RepID=A0A926RSS8_9BACL|nr:hypothetical protein [Polycladospora coralii]MBD1371835.1 hypothetical protein [Polycladospora coralii]MBS7529296.1 hypothetical protein [Polycladospora coralii]